jgi:uncharacterized membrane protein
MDQTHIHLLITHLPVFGSILGVFILVQGIWRRSSSVLVAAYTLFLCSSAGAVVAYLTGESAEETAENIQGISENMIEQHEDFAIIALVALIILGIAALIGILIEYKKSAFTKRVAFGVLVISVISFGLVAWTGYLGGQIRHTEISGSTPMHEQGKGSEERD